MDSFNHVIGSLLRLLVQLGNLIVAGIVAIELWLRTQLAQLGVAPDVQTLIMLLLAAVLVVCAFRLFGGLIRVALMLVLILVASQIIMPLVPQ